MKRIYVLLWMLSVSGLLAQVTGDESRPKLTGLIRLPDFKRVLLEAPGPPRGQGLITLSEGERQGQLAVLSINDREGSVRIDDRGGLAQLRMEAQETVDTTEITGSNLRLSNADFEQVLDLYARISDHTVLQHPAIKAVRFSLTATASNRAEAVAVLERLFQRHDLASIRDGAKFVMIVPVALTNTIQAPSGETVSKTTEPALLPIGTIRFQNADLRQALTIYGKLVGRKLVKSEGLPASTIRLRTVNDLTKAEAACAFETLFCWNGIEIVPVGDLEFEAVPVSSTRDSRRN